MDIYVHGDGEIYVCDRLCYRGICDEETSQASRVATTERPKDPYFERGTGSLGEELA